MARVKKPNTPPPPPKHPRECKHGCCDCKHYRLDVKSLPCRDCERWNYWEDAHPEKNNTVSIPSISTANISVQTPLPATNEPKKRERRNSTAVLQTVESPLNQEQAPVMPKKRGRKPKIATVGSEPLVNVTEQTVSELAKRMRKTRKVADDAPNLLQTEKSQLTMF